MIFLVWILALVFAALLSDLTVIEIRQGGIRDLIECRFVCVPNIQPGAEESGQTTLDSIAKPLVQVEAEDTKPVHIITDTSGYFDEEDLVKEEAEAKEEKPETKYGDIVQTEEIQQL